MWRVLAMMLWMSPTSFAQPGAVDPNAPPPDPNAPPPPPPLDPNASQAAPYPGQPYAAQPAYVEPPPKPRVADHGYAAMGLAVGTGGPGPWLIGAYTLEGAFTIPHAPLRLRVRGLMNLKGGTVESDWSGEWKRYGLGVEARLCDPRGVYCFFADLDGGYQLMSMYDHGGDLVRSDPGYFIAPRGGLDFGRSVRFRIALDFNQHFTDGERWANTTLAVALGYQL